MITLKNTRTAQTAKSLNIPAPVGGLNGRDALADMDPKYAYLLDNWLPGTTSVDARKGFTSYVTGLDGPVTAIAEYSGGASSKLLAATNAGSLYDVSVAGAVGAALQTGRAVGTTLSTTMFSNAGAQLLIGTTGGDQPFSYDGTTLTALAITGLLTGTDSDIISCATFKSRLYYIQKHVLGFYYMPVGNISGAASFFDLSQVAKLGGEVMFMAAYSADNETGTGPDDYAVFATSKGEYIIYKGYDPSTAANWAIVGRYYASPPVNRRAFFSFKSDLVICTTSGLVTMSTIRSTGDVNDKAKSLTDILGDTITTYLTSYGSVLGLMGLRYPRAGLLVLNVPISLNITGAYVQYVMNTKTNAWARITGWNGISFAVFGTRLYFGTSNGAIMLADEGLDDNGTSIQANAKQAYNHFDDGYGSGSAFKHFHFMRLLLGTVGRYAISTSFSVDYSETVPPYAPIVPQDGSVYWDVGTWDVDLWGSEQQGQVSYSTIGKRGEVGSIWLRGNLKGCGVSWYSTNVAYSVLKGLL